MGFDWVVSVFTVENPTSISVKDEINGNAILWMVRCQRRCRKVESVTSGEPLIAFTESIEPPGGLLGPESTFLCREDFLLVCIRSDFEYCQIIYSPASATATKIAANNAKRTRCRRA